MTSVTASGFEVSGNTTIICDFSPPRSGDPSHIATCIPDADFLLVNRNPGRAVRADSAMLASHLRQATGKEVVFALLTRDMNRLAIHSYLLGAQMLGLENVVVAQGDPFSAADRGKVAAGSGYRPTELIADIGELNRGRDFRGRRLDSPTSFCVGATLDLAQPVGRQAALTAAKIHAGARFLVTQPIFDPAVRDNFEAEFRAEWGGYCPVPIYWGLQMLERGSVSFGQVPERVRRELEKGRSGVNLALELFESFQESSMRNIYLLPPIRQGGERDYEAAQEFIQAARSMG